MMEAIKQSKISCKSIIYITLLFFIYSFSAFGQSAKINKVWLEYETIKNGDRGMTIHADIDVKGMKGKKIECIAYFYNSKKNKLMGGVSGYKTKSGQVCTSCYATPRYDSSNYKDFDIFMPYESLPFLVGEQTYYILVAVLDVSKGDFISDNWDYYVPFTGIGNTPQDDLASRVHLSENTESSNSLNHNLKAKTFYGSHAVCINAFSTQTLSLSGHTLEVFFNSEGNPEFYSESMYPNKAKKLYYNKTDSNCKFYKDDAGWGFGIDADGVIINEVSMGVLTSRVYKNYPTNYQNNSGNMSAFGSGGDINNHGNYGTNNNGVSSTYRTCPSCGGSGICSSCHGSGGEWRDTGYYTGSDSRSWISCPSCNGSKRCFNCHGSGKI